MLKHFVFLAAHDSSVGTLSNMEGDLEEGVAGINFPSGNAENGYFSIDGSESTGKTDGGALLAGLRLRTDILCLYMRVMTWRLSLTRDLF